jgi:hypothetical protein
LAGHTLSAGPKQATALPQIGPTKMVGATRIGGAIIKLAWTRMAGQVKELLTRNGKRGIVDNSNQKRAYGKAIQVKVHLISGHREGDRIMKQKVTLSLDGNLVSKFRSVQKETGLSLSGFVDAKIRELNPEKKFYILQDKKDFFRSDLIFASLDEAVEKANKLPDYVGVVKGNLVFMR